MTFLDKIFSCILGIIIGLIFYKCYNQKEIYYGPNSNNLKKVIHKYKNKCFHFSPFPVACGIRDLNSDSNLW